MFSKNAFFLLALTFCVFFCFATGEVVVTEDAGFLAVAGTALVFVMKFFGATITAGSTLVLWRVFQKWGLDNIQGTDKIAAAIVSRACAWVEVWAAKQAEKPTSEEKYKMAIEKALEFAEKVGILSYVQKHLDMLLEPHLRDYGDLSILKKN